jgi:hypothetical protein
MITLDSIIENGQLEHPPQLVNKPSEPVAIDNYLASIQPKPFNPSSVQLSELDACLFGLSYSYMDKKTKKMVEVNPGQPKATIIDGDKPIMGAEARETLLDDIVRATVMNSDTFDAHRCYEFAKMRCDLTYQEVTSYAKAKLSAMAGKNIIKVINASEPDMIVYSR